jgi:hypothetical protein
VTQLCIDTGEGFACKDYPVVPLCWSDEHCNVGASCQGAHPCPCGSDCLDEPGVCSEGTGCCNVDGDCNGGDICLENVCTSTLPGTQCWTDAMCSAAQECVGGELCPCDVECAVLDTPGKCFPEGQECCLTDGDCPGAGDCVSNKCHPSAGPGECWGNGDCLGEFQCVGAVTCECGAVDCTPAAGTCNLVQTCCVNDSQCIGGDICESGACKPLPADGLCWTSADCEDQICVGASAPCACNVPCSGESPGTCSPLPEGCCASDGECGPDQVCVGQHCKPAPEGDQCWADADCGDKEECNGASPCPCGQDCDDDSPGVCELKVGCCESADDCNPGFLCLGDKCHPGLLTSDKCWLDSDCGEGGLCEKANICTCEGPLCIPVAGTCAGGGETEAEGGEGEGGELGAPPGGCCDPDDGGCPAGQVCVETAVCAPIPSAGNCWTDEDCIQGSCLNPNYCGCNEDCNLLEPGKCS